MYITNLRYRFLLVIVMLFFGAVFFSCKDVKKEEIEKMHEEVMYIHDEIMPRMSEIHHLKKELKNSLKPGQDSTLVFEKLTELANADDAMMEWMDKFRQVDEDQSYDEKKTYYLEEKKRISVVKEIMEKAILNSEKYIDENK